MNDIKLLFKRNDMIDAGWNIKKEDDHQVTLEHDVTHPDPEHKGISCQARLVLNVEGDSLITYVPNYAWDDTRMGHSMRSVLIETKTPYLTA